MISANDNAFIGKTEVDTYKGFKEIVYQKGLTKREYFAAMAYTSLIGTDGCFSSLDIAKQSLAMVAGQCHK